jgi:hypothetical protein
MEYTGKIQIKNENEIQEFDATVDMLNSIITIQTPYNISISFELNYQNHMYINSTDYRYIISQYSTIKNNNNLFILGQIKDAKSDIMLFDFFIYFMNVQFNIDFNKIHWVTRESINDTLIDIIKFNKQRNYQQGVFANNLSRNDIYDLAKNINSNDLFKNFLIKTLDWGDYNNVVADRFKKQPKGHKP